MGFPREDRQGDQYPKLKLSRVKNGFQVIARNDTHVFADQNTQSMMIFITEWVDEQVRGSGGLVGDAPKLDSITSEKPKTAASKGNR